MPEHYFVWSLMHSTWLAPCGNYITILTSVATGNNSKPSMNNNLSLSSAFCYRWTGCICAGPCRGEKNPTAKYYHALRWMVKWQQKQKATSISLWITLLAANCCELWGLFGCLYTHISGWPKPCRFLCFSFFIILQIKIMCFGKGW